MCKICGKLCEYDAYSNMLEECKDSFMISCVVDSYNVYKATNYFTRELKNRIESDDYPKLILRPDSGEQIEVIGKMLDIMEENNVAFTTNTKGFKVFDKYGLIWGDGVTPEAILKIIDFVVNVRGYSAEIIAFGSGGDLMQNVNRDTMRFAVKACSAIVDGKEREVYKQPLHGGDEKKSKAGRQELIKWKGDGWKDTKVGPITTVTEARFVPEDQEKLLELVFENGEIIKEITLDDIKTNIAESKTWYTCFKYNTTQHNTTKVAA